MVLRITEIEMGIRDAFIKKSGLPACCLLIILCISVYYPILHFDFLSFDEEQYVTKNPMVQAGLTWEGFQWAFTTTEAGFWQPVVWLSHMLDCELFGMNPGGHHISNLLLHMVNTLLLFLMLKSMTDAPARSAFVAALFAVHPLHVESVAWVADRKDLLCALFWFLTMSAYFFYVKSPGMLRYLYVIVLFIIGLMSKPMIVTLPAILLFLDFWPLRRLSEAPLSMGRDIVTIIKASRNCRWLVLEKIPLFLMTLPIILITFLAETQAEALPPQAAFPLHLRLANTLVNYVHYLGKTFYPLHLSIFYPQPGLRPLWQPFLAGLFLAGLTILALRMSRRYPYIVTGWFWYVIALVPVIGLIQVGSHVMADRYTYIPLIGIFMLVAWGGSEILNNCGWQRMSLYVACVMVVVLALIAGKQVHVWQNTETVFRQALAATENNYLAHNNLGAVLMDCGKVEEASLHYRESLRIKPHFNLARVNLGNALITMGRIDEGILCYRTVLKNNPKDRLAMRNLADIFLKQGNYVESLVIYKKLYGHDPNDPGLNNNMGVALSLSGQPAPAVFYLKRALSLNPDNIEAKDNLRKLGYANGQ